MRRTTLVVAILLVAFVASTLGKRPKEDLLAYPKQGNCKAAFVRYYCMESGCKQFTGCYRGGFRSRKECTKICPNSGKKRPRWPHSQRERSTGLQE
uniref:Putative monolaris n=1 Tax=Rhipicephalus pulchellus TaxID=72859 RepID=L7M9Z4_RHIPC